MQTKTKVSTPIRLLLNTEMTNVRTGAERLEPLVQMLAGCEMNAAAVETLLETKHRMTIQSSKSTSGSTAKELKAGMWTDICTLMLRRALTTGTKGENNSNAHDGWLDKQNVVYMYKGTFPSRLRKERSADPSQDMDIPWRCCAKWKKPDTNGQILYDSAQIHKDRSKQNKGNQGLRGGVTF